MGNPDPHEGKSGNKRSSTVVAAFSTSQWKGSQLLYVLQCLFLYRIDMYTGVYI